MPQGEINDNMGDRVYLPTDKKEELQLRILHKKSQPLEKMERVIGEIRKLMLRSVEAVIKGEINRREPTIEAGKNQKKKKKKQ
jgi:hypothetical protein